MKLAVLLPEVIRVDLPSRSSIYLSLKEAEALRDRLTEILEKVTTT
jgi:hypothetical protein